MQQVHLFISGFVQGVGYRQFVKSHAKKLGLTGWVRNLPDGRVEAVIQGEKDLIENLITLSRRGPVLSDVDHVEVLWDEVEETYSDFLIVTLP